MTEQEVGSAERVTCGSLTGTECEGAWFDFCLLEWRANGQACALNNSDDVMADLDFQNADDAPIGQVVLIVHRCPLCGARLKTDLARETLYGPGVVAVAEAVVPATERDHYRRALSWFIGQYWPERVDELVGVALAATKEGETDAITPAR